MKIRPNLLSERGFEKDAVILGGQESLLRSPFPPSPFRQRGINKIQAVRQYAGAGLGDTALFLSILCKVGDAIILEMDRLSVLPMAPDISHN